MADTLESPSVSKPAQPIVTVTEAAANKARDVLNNSSNQGIRIAVVGGGCAGLQYDLQPVAEPSPQDMVMEFYGVPFYVNPMVVPYIKGTEIDFSNALMDGGFRFKNPNAASSCGCGTSFGV